LEASFAQASGDRISESLVKTGEGLIVRAVDIVE
jgi:hypothetical protein